MAESIVVPSTDKSGKYLALLPQLKSLIGTEKNQIANLANVAAALKSTFDFFWVGFYIVKNSQLVLGPFQGPLACTRIDYGKGVCGATWKEGKTIVVPDVDQFPGHIACSSASKSEIVVPGFLDGNVFLVLDVDSDRLDDFDDEDAHGLEAIVGLVEKVAAGKTPIA